MDDQVYNDLVCYFTACNNERKYPARIYENKSNRKMITNENLSSDNLPNPTMFKMVYLCTEIKKCLCEAELSVFCELVMTTVPLVGISVGTRRCQKYQNDFIGKE